MSDLPLGWATRLYPSRSGASTGPIHGDPLLSAPLPDEPRPRVAINMVVTLDGRIASEHGTAAGLGSRSDMDLLRRLRAEADALLHGAGTLRAEKFAPQVPRLFSRRRMSAGLAPQPLAVLVSASGAIPADHPWLRTATPNWPRLIYTTPAAAARLAAPGVEVHTRPGGELDLRDVLRDLWSRGVRSVVCEGGPTLNAGLFQADCVDELFVTLVPRVQGGTDRRRLVGEGALATRRLALRSVYERDGELFLRYARTSG